MNSFHDAHAHLGPCDDPQLVMQPAEMGVDGVRGDAEGPGNGDFGLVIEDAAYNLQLATGEVERARDSGPECSLNIAAPFACAG